YTKRLVSSAPSLASQRLTSAHRAEVREQAAEAAQEHLPRQSEFGEGLDLIVEVDQLVKEFEMPGGRPWAKNYFRAVDDVSFGLRRGTTTAIVGESGSGKSTVARMVLDLLEPTSGTVRFDGVDIRTLQSKEEQLAFRRQIQPV